MEDRSTFRSVLSIRSMVSILEDKLPQFSWRVGDSEYDGFYVLGKDAAGGKVKIIEEDDSGTYHIGIHFYAADPPMEAERRSEYDCELRGEIVAALEGKGK
jgi:hypothetical protein